MSIDLETAREIIRHALATARSHDLKPLAVAVLDPGGHVVAFEREDGSAIMRFSIAHGKAHGALALGAGSRAWMTRAETQPYFVAAAGVALGGGLIPVPGGVLALDGTGVTVGAVGVTGDSSDNDELVAVAAIEAVGWIADTG